MFLHSPSYPPWATGVQVDIRDITTLWTPACLWALTSGGPEYRSQLWAPCPAFCCPQNQTPPLG